MENKSPIISDEEICRASGCGCVVWRKTTWKDWCENHCPSFPDYKAVAQASDAYWQDRIAEAVKARDIDWIKYLMRRGLMTVAPPYPYNAEKDKPKKQFIFNPQKEQTGNEQKR